MATKVYHIYGPPSGNENPGQKVPPAKNYKPLLTILAILTVLAIASR